jgi:hypothetical protein
MELWNELKNRKEQIAMLVMQNDWDTLKPLIELQKRYDFIEKYKAAEKTEFGIAKGFLNVFDVREQEWNLYLKDYFKCKYPNIKVLDYKIFFKKVGDYQPSYRDVDNNLGKLDLQNEFILLNVDTRQSKIYESMLAKCVKLHKMDINMYDCIPRGYGYYGYMKRLLEIKKLRLFQHLRYPKFTSKDISANENKYDYIIN